jgi:hypothetical protein
MGYLFAVMVGAWLTDTAKNNAHESFVGDDFNRLGRMIRPTLSIESVILVV